MEEEWVARLLQQDKEALALIVEQYGDDVLRTARWLTGDYHAAEDIVQEVFLKVYRSIGQLREPSKLRPWIMKITVHMCKAQMRKASWSQLLLNPKGWALLFVRSDHMVAIDEDISLRLTLEEILKELPYHYREVIVLHYYYDLSIDQMREWTGVSAGTLKSRLSRARMRLSQLWKEEEDNETAFESTKGMG
ncbi:RNA polymerase sigma factor [Paenibacillus aquistagni]|uniref:RNA polymerase sigma factor n=1 Tax=Paenibacillus aquistagni TaxID=1852522 RepID=A0A1X7LEN0_9BACL|nr:RNA polymerase sigma factor [Paenibacillus aquistagni]SMG52316.1 RNA polymerase, sigma subunit, SigV [Paenibacillus aquistagni]